MWDSFLAAKAGEWIVSIEEEGMDERGFIPEGNRIWGEVMDVDFGKREVVVRVRRWKNLAKKVWKFRKEVLRW